ncbi:MAG TPA: DUF2975 domain-containing protein [Steroidobacteraceae bacterium]|nr:DUF2975 domain-containing protein [Steroidobacteraceae bacterium]
MNASASSLDREVEVQSKIGKIRKFGRNARALFAALFGFGLVGIVFVLIFRALGAGGVVRPPASESQSGIGVAGLEPITTAGFTAAQLNTTELKVWALLVVAMVAGVALAAMYQLYRLFGNLAAGAIFTPENVRRLRHIGVLWVLAALLGIVIPCVAAMLVQLGFFLPSRPSNIELQISLSESLSSFFGAALVLLGSWIMDVGLHEKEHADALKRDADLVI